jgi:pimeloyl-ACP methyl ester carboxylesterase
MAEALEFDDVGAGPAVVLVHGHPFDRTMWRPQLTPLVDAGFRVVAPDLRGYGTSRATAGAVAMSELADDVAGLLQQLGIEKAAVVGLSMGGLVAMELALAAPSSIWALGLVATTAQPVTDEEAGERGALAATIEEQGIGPLVREMSPRLVGPDCPADVRAGIVEMMRRANPVGAAAALRGRARRPDYRAALTKLEMPSFVCVGTDDPWSTAAVTEELVGCLAEPRTVVLTGVGHMPNLEAPDEFNEAILDFLRSALPVVVHDPAVGP